MSSGSPVFSIIATFATNAEPSSVRIDTSGNLLGTTARGGPSSDGTVFEIQKIGATYGGVTDLVDFDGHNGIEPSALLFDPSGNIIGGTYVGGVNNRGTVFEIKKSGNNYQDFKTIKSVEAYTLIIDPVGNLFGTSAGYASGTIFEIRKSGASYGSVSTIQSFSDASPASLSELRDGNFVGIAAGVNYSYAFELEKSLSSTGYTTVRLATFDEKISHPVGLVVDASGNLFGITDGISGPSTIYEIKHSGSSFGSIQTVATFNSRPSQIIVDSAGNIFGVEEYGGQFGYGAIFKIKKDGHSYGSVTTLFSCTTANGLPSSLVADDSGNLFGTFQGANFEGGVFELTNSGYQVSLPPPPRQDTWQGHAGSPAVPTDGFFDNAADWVSGLAPDSNTDALLGEGHYTVRTRAGTDYLHSLVVSSGATLVIGGATYATTLTTTATTIDGRLTVESGSEVSNSGATDIGGVLRLRGGLLTGGTIDGHGGGALVGDGTVESSLSSASGGASALSIDAIGGSIILTGDNALSGSLGGSGTLEFLGGSDVLESGVTVTAGSVVLSGSHVTLQASLSFNHNLVLNAGTLDVGTNDLDLQGQTTLTGGSIDGTDGSVIRLNGVKHDVVSNGNTSIAPRVLNNGVVDIEGGSLDLMGHVYGAGDFTFSTSKPASLELGDTLGKNQTIDFGTNASAQLIIDKNYTFEGMITNLRSGDTIDLTQVSLRGTSIGFRPGNTDVLQVTRAGRTVASLKLSGAAYDGSQFSLSADEHTGSLITFHG